MNANELMVGDWVYVTYPTYPIPAIVEAISPREGSAEGYTFQLRHKPNEVYFARKGMVKPIPLTPEILEKNGFEKNKFVKSFSEYVLRKGESEIIVATGEIEEMWIRRTLAERAYCLPYPKYVHQLQHALRLCGIDKEIEL